MMRPTHIFIAAVIALTAVATIGCGRKKEQTDSTPPPADTAVEEVDTLREFASPDLGLWHLTGPVASASFRSYQVSDTASMPKAGATYSMDSIRFDRKGLVTTMVNGVFEGGKMYIDSDLRFTYDADGAFKEGRQCAPNTPPMRVKLSRSSGGYLQVLQVLGTDGELSNDYAYLRLIEWSNGVMFADDIETNEATTRQRYHYGEDAAPVKTVVTITDMGGDIKVEQEIRYTAFDAYGNWTERRVVSHISDTSGEADGTHQETKTSTEYLLERRQIHYYPREEENP